MNNRNFRNYFLTQFISQIGTWMQQVAISWVVYRLTDSTFWLGVAAFSSQLPTLLFGLFAGVFADRFDRRKLMCWTQGLSALQALTLVFLSASGLLSLSILILMNIILGLLNTIDMPTRQALSNNIRNDPKNNQNAIALMSLTIHSSRLLGPVIAGALLAFTSEAVCFLINFLSFLPILFVLISMNINSNFAAPTSQSFFESLKDGARSAIRTPSIRIVILFLAFINFMLSPYTNFFPALAALFVEGDPRALGVITAVGAAGAIFGSIFLAKKNLTNPGLALWVNGIILSLSMILLNFFVSARNYPITMVCLFFAGGSLLILNALCNTVIQSVVEEDKRARVLSIFNFAFLGTVPLGTLIMGWIAEKSSLQNAYLFHAIFGLLGTLLFLKKANLITEDFNHRINIKSVEEKIGKTSA